MELHGPLCLGLNCVSQIHRLTLFSLGNRVIVAHVISQDEITRVAPTQDNWCPCKGGHLGTETQTHMKRLLCDEAEVGCYLPPRTVGTPAAATPWSWTSRLGTDRPRMPAVSAPGHPRLRHGGCPGPRRSRVRVGGQPISNPGLWPHSHPRASVSWA